MLNYEITGSQDKLYISTQSQITQVIHLYSNYQEFVVLKKKTIKMNGQRCSIFPCIFNVYCKNFFSCNKNYFLTAQKKILGLKRK